MHIDDALYEVTLHTVSVGVEVCGTRTRMIEGPCWELSILQG